MKPYPDYKGHPLKDIVPKKISFVTEGANRKKFFLFKSKEGKDTIFMDKNTALTLIKSGSLDESQMGLLVASVSDEDKAEVQAAMDVEVSKRGAKFSKDSMTKLTDISNKLTEMTGLLQKLLAGASKGEESEDEKVQKIAEALKANKPLEEIAKILGIKKEGKKDGDKDEDIPDDKVEGMLRKDLELGEDEELEEESETEEGK